MITHVHERMIYKLVSKRCCIECDGEVFPLEIHANIVSIIALLREGCSQTIVIISHLGISGFSYLNSEIWYDNKNVT